jgi:predicted double-glycine peptidase
MESKYTLTIIILAIFGIALFSYVVSATGTYSTANKIVEIDDLNLLKGVPDVRQPTNYSCGPTCLQAVLNYYGIDTRMDVLMNMTNCTLNGTTPENIALAARQFGLNAEVKEGLTLQDLKNYNQQVIAVIIDCQAWTDNKNTTWAKDKLDGHYMVLIGIDNENVYFEDPSILGSRGYIPSQEFLERWHDEIVDPNSGKIRKTYHLGIIIAGKKPAIHPLFIKIE